MKATLLFVMLSAIVFVPLLGFAPTVLADTDSGGNSVTLPDPLGGKDFITILKQVVNFLIAAAIPIAALMIIYGAYQIMFAGGDVEKVTTGKRTILYAVTALVIVILAWSIIAVIQNILGVTVPNQ